MGSSSTSSTKPSSWNSTICRLVKTTCNHTTCHVRVTMYSYTFSPTFRVDGWNCFSSGCHHSHPDKRCSIHIYKFPVKQGVSPEAGSLQALAMLRQVSRCSPTGSCKEEQHLQKKHHLSTFPCPASHYLPPALSTAEEDLRAHGSIALSA